MTTLTSDSTIEEINNKIVKNTKSEIMISLIKTLESKFPNDMDFGQVIRELIKTI